jgi:Protein of unknown function (DUF2752)
MDPAITSEPWPPGPAGDLAPGSARRPWARLWGLAAIAGVTAYVGLVDPARSGAYPVCPSRFVLGVDCPACGGLRGTHDLLHGHIGAALDHNLLLPVWLGLFAVMLGLWLVPLLGRPAPAVRVPRWLVVGGIAVAVGFAVLRNLPVAGLEFLASDA